ncbi:hypothetical protein [Microbulbifer sp. JMSA003]|uniref:hypothetical protein n=1 Tax=Microbulbifer sp. JMSA003 TaxID=3243369 RepID=UPI0040394C7C
MFAVNKDLVEVFDNGDAQYGAIDKSLASDIAYEQYSKGPIYNVTPFFNEINEVSLGEIVQKPDKTLGGEYKYGFNSKNQIVCITEYTRTPGVYYKTFYIRRLDLTEIRKYSCSNRDFELSIVSFLYEKDGLPDKVETYSEAAAMLQEFQYKRGQVSEVLVKKRGNYTKKESVNLYCFNYNEGDLSSIVKKDLNGVELKVIEIDGYRNKFYESEKLIKLLYESVVSKLYSLPKEEAIAVVGLIDDCAAKDFPVPLLAIGTVDDINDGVFDVNSFRYYDIEALDLNTPEISDIYCLANKSKLSSEGLQVIYKKLVKQLKNTNFIGLSTAESGVYFFCKDVSEL